MNLGERNYKYEVNSLYKYVGFGSWFIYPVNDLTESSAHLDTNDIFLVVERNPFKEENRAPNLLILFKGILYVMFYATNDNLGVSILKIS